MVKKLFALSIALILLGGCGVNLYGDMRPAADENEKWVSEEPRMHFTWTKDVGGFWGEIETNGVTTKVRLRFDYGTGVEVCEFDSASSPDFGLFDGDCKFGKNKLVITVTEDWTNFFAGELPTITLVRHARQENGSFAPAE